MGRFVVAGLLAALPLASQEAGPRGMESRLTEEPIELDGRLVAFEGIASTPEGNPAVGAVVVTSAGGQAIVDEAGHYLVEARVPLEADSVQVTVVGRGSGSPSATERVTVAPGADWVPVRPLALAGTCSPSWLPTFGGEPGTNNTVNALVVFDDGNGPALYAGGDFTTAGGLAVNRVARWDGSSWSALGSGMNGVVYALAVYDDGNGPALYAGGHFTIAGGVAAERIARWDGSSWSSLGFDSISVVEVHALVVHDDGSGPALYVGVGSEVLRWNGSSWSGLGSAMNGTVLALAVYDDGSGPALYAGGAFTVAGGVSAKRVARYDGASWSALGSGLTNVVSSLAAYDVGNGPRLCAGGYFLTEGAIASWDGSSWSALGSGFGISISSLLAFDDGSGPALYAGHSSWAFVPSTLYRWNGSNWSPVGGPPSLNGGVDALAVYDDGSGPKLHVGGGFTSAGNVALGHIASWDGSSWSSLGGGGMNRYVEALAVYDDGQGPALYAGGKFTTTGGVAANFVARWNGTSWSAVGNWWINEVVALVAHDDGSGPALFAAGTGMGSSRIARWDGTSWSPLSSDVGNLATALAVYDDGGGPALYAGGSFSTAGGMPVGRIARWDGSSWSALGSGVAAVSPTSATVVTLAVYDDGSGPALYVGGDFTTAGGAPANQIARWDGSSWSPLGSGLDGVAYSLAVYDDGSGPALYVGGDFTTAGGVAASHIARWDGSSWAALGSGLDARVRSLLAHDDGSGPALLVGGDFTTAGGVAANRLARWDGVSWSPVGSGMNGPVYALAVFDDGQAPALIAGGNFSSAFDSHDSYLAKWGSATSPVITAPPSVFARDRGAPGESVSFTVTAFDCQDLALPVTCVPPSGSFFPRGKTLVTCTASDSSGNQVTRQFPVVVQPKLEREVPPAPAPR